MHPYRTHTCGQLRATDAGQHVWLSGWIHRKRYHTMWELKGSALM